MERKILETIQKHKDQFAGECNNWLASPRVKNLIRNRIKNETQIEQINENSSNAHPISIKQIKYFLQRSALQLQHGRLDTKIKKSLGNIIHQHIAHGNDLLQETGEIDSNRSKLIQNTRNQRNPFIAVYHEHADLVKHIDIALSWVDNTLAHVSNAQGAQVVQHLTKNSQTKFGQLTNAASQATDIYSQMSIPESLANTKTCVSIVYDKAYQLQTRVLPQNWQSISTSDIALTLAGKIAFQSSSLGGLSSFLNFVSITDLGSELSNLRHGLVLLRTDAIAPIDAYHQFENNRETLVREVLDNLKIKLLNHKLNSSASINEILLNTGKVALGSEDSKLSFNFKRAAIGIAIGSTISAGAIALSIHFANGLREDNVQQRTESPLTAEKSYSLN